MFHLKKNLMIKLLFPVILLFVGLGCSSNQNLITQPQNFNPDSYLQPNHYGIKNSTEFLKQSDEVIENSKFVPARVEGGLKVLMSNVTFPHKARYQFQEGKVYMNLFIDKTGKIQFVRILESPDVRLSHYSIYAVKNTDFFPATLNDLPVKSTRLIMFNFSFKLDNDVTY